VERRKARESLANMCLEWERRQFIDFVDARLFAIFLNGRTARRFVQFLDPKVAPWTYLRPFPPPRNFALFGRFKTNFPVYEAPISVRLTTRRRFSKYIQIRSPRVTEQRRCAPTLPPPVWLRYYCQRESAGNCRQCVLFSSDLPTDATRTPKSKLCSRELVFYFNKPLILSPGTRAVYLPRVLSTRRSSKQLVPRTYARNVYETTFPAYIRNRLRTFRERFRFVFKLSARLRRDFDIANN